MSKVTKKFDKSLHNKFDSQAREKLRTLLKNTDYEVVNNPDPYGVDCFLLKNKNKVVNIELEVKRVWKAAFNYPTVQFPLRKTKFCKLDKPTIFLMFNHDLSSYLTVSGDVLLSSKVKEVPNKYVKSSEYFYQVPVDKIVFNNINSTLESLNVSFST